MSGHSRYIQVGCVLLAIGLLVAAGLLQQPIQQRSKEANLITEANSATMERTPEMAVLNTIPGGLRVLFVNYLWIRSQAAHQDGRHYDAYQLAELICQLQPRHPGVWAFQAWNMGWNISVTTNTAEQRWRWVYNGIKLLRDKGIPLNPRSLMLYKELSWFFVSKLGGQLDDAHTSYKRRWAGMMQFLLGAPPFDESLNTTLEEETQQVIDAFAKIANAPLDKALSRQGKEQVQADQVAVLLQDKTVAEYADLLSKLSIKIDQTFLEAYNQFSRDYAVECTRNFPPAIEGEAQKAVSDLINDPKYAPQRDKILAFLRAQLLWNVYKMDPDYMLELMKKYKIPLDWRHSMAHGLYWAAYGMHVCKPKDHRRMIALNNSRNVLNAMKTLTATGLVAIQQNSSTPDYPIYYESSDLRYIQPTHEQHMAYITEVIKSSGKKFDKNVLGAGHVNFLVEAIRVLVADGRYKAAQRYYDFIKTDYKKSGGYWDFENVRDFVMDNLQRESADGLRYVVVRELLQYAFKRAYLARGIYGNPEGYREQFGFAQKLFTDYQKQAVTRMKVPVTFTDEAAMAMIRLLERPRIFGLSFSLPQRSSIYRSMGDKPQIQVRVYLSLEKFFRYLCDKDGEIKMDIAFPKPPGLEAFREKIKQRMMEDKPNTKIPK